MVLHENKNTVWTGVPLSNAKKILIMLHGRGADARDILSLSGLLTLNEFAIAAPQATHHQWYPNSFLEKPQHNEPWLSSGLELLQQLFNDILSKGFSSEDVYFLGFSQGACLALESATRNAKKYGGIAAFTGGLIGDKIYAENYHGDFAETPVFLSTGNPDPHVPLDRVRDTAKILKSMHANVQLEIYDGRPHTISQDEITKANKFVFVN